MGSYATQCVSLFLALVCTHSTNDFFAGAGILLVIVVVVLVVRERSWRARTADMREDLSGESKLNRLSDAAAANDDDRP